MMRIVIADDHQIFREGLAQLFATLPDVELVGQAENGDELLEYLSSQEIDVAIVDVSMPGPGVPVICKEIREQGAVTKVVVLTMHEDARMAQQMMANGASGYVLKRNAFSELRDALQAMSQRETFVSPSLAGDLAELATGKTITLSTREVQVVQLVASGRTNAQIASALGISIKTVQTHRARAMEKLGVHSAAEVVRRLSELGLLPS